MYSFINAKIYDYRNYYENAYIVFSEKISMLNIFLNTVCEAKEGLKKQRERKSS